MNSAVRRFALFFFSLATLASCEDPSDIGIDLQDENLAGTTYTDTLTINTGTVSQPDSILAFNQDRAILGGYWDAVLGNVKGTTFTEVALSGTDVVFGDKNKPRLLDKLVLTLDYDSTFYGDIGEPITFEVHELTESFQEKASYFTNSSLAYDPKVLGSVTFKPEIVEVKDTTGKIIGEHYSRPSIVLDQEFAQNLLNQSGTTNLKNQANFAQFLKGFAFVPTGDPKFLLGLNLGSNNSKLTLYFRNGSGTGADSVRKSHTFFFGSATTRDFSNITADRSGTALEGLGKNVLLESSETGDESYIQSGTQLLTKLTIPHLAKLKEKHGNIVINRAELVIPIKTASDTKLAAPKALALYETNSSNRILKNSNGETRVVPFDAAYALNSTRYPAQLLFDADKKQYTVNITSYVQAILLGKKPNDGLLIAPAKFTNAGSGTVAISKEIIPYRAILSNTVEKGVKLRVYFTKVD
ncbi:DUF4270 domain-containing protein [Pontibacter sp. KCTC 32443]|uniref:DUF4270 family protein n=1 Tax=Pontibacter TaxID=323449 RepID=UPI00164D331E|nr:MULTISPECIES: DUF4270 family protein [Pontibacter]MBC5774520.1 DUF4270 domain-containing protein [Pontibacter sp. KCTC 32443]